MHNHKRSLIFLCLLVFAAPTQEVQAADITFVSHATPGANDANTSVDCSRTKPCQSINAAMSVTAPRGIVMVLDSSGYGSFKVTKSVQVVAAPGAQVLINPSVGNAVTINASQAEVTLRGLYLTSAGPGVPDVGIQVKTVRALHVENCVISGFTVNGINLEAAAELYVKDTIVRNVGTGIEIRPAVASPNTRVSIDHCRLENSFTGLNVWMRDSHVTIRDSVIAGNVSGIFANSGTDDKFYLMVENCTLTGNTKGIHIMGAGTTRLMLTNSTVSDNITGLEMAVGAKISRARVAHTTFTHNETAIKRNGGIVTSFGNNRQVDNGTSDTFSSIMPEI